MRLIVMGCEYTGKRTLGAEIAKWWTGLTGTQTKFHDHFTKPVRVQDNPTTIGEVENEQVANLVPSLFEKFMRYQIEYHIRPFVEDDDLFVINLGYGEAVYAPLYYGYGLPGQYGDRQFMARYWDREFRHVYPDAILVMTKASPDVVRERLRAAPRPGSPVTEENVEHILRRFEEEFNNSLILRRFMLDTSKAAVDETLQEFVRNVDPLICETDALRILRHRAVTGG
jgi:hypothetical protein